MTLPDTGDGRATGGAVRPPTWRTWCPGLDNDDLTLRDALTTLPAAPPTAIPWIVRLFENPQGWLRLHGAVNLRNHDMIHVLLGRGLLGQDEAFVIDARRLRGFYARERMVLPGTAASLRLPVDEIEPVDRRSPPATAA